MTNKIISLFGNASIWGGYYDDNLGNYIFNSARTLYKFSANLTYSYDNEYCKIEFAL
jgi:hypothetical protein